MSVAQHHAEWLSLLEVSGPFLSLPVLSEVFPHELEAHESAHRARLKAAYQEWEQDRNDPAIHRAWIRFVLEETLELEAVLLEGQGLPAGLDVHLAVHAETLRPDLVVKRCNGRQSTVRLLITTLEPNQKPNRPLRGTRRWNASPTTRMMELCHRTGIPLGLVTNGEQWVLVWAKPGEATGFATWHAELLLEEPITLRAFRSLLSVRRFFGVADDETLEALYRRSVADQQEVTDTLGRQVRKAVELLISTLDWADREQHRRLLADYDERDLYQAALTVMMRLVFLLCAEERDMLLLGKEDLYDQYYAISPLRQQLRETADLYGEEIMGQRYDAWCRLLATFRAVHAGVAHEGLQLPAYGGSLFDPDRFPFLEGRPAATCWKDTPAKPLPIDNRTVLHLLESLQLLAVKGTARSGVETQRLSFRALDIEQIGHVYEGLLDHTAVRASATVLGLEGAKGSEPEVPLPEIESRAEQSHDELIRFLKKATGRSEKALEKRLALYDEVSEDKLSVVCDRDDNLTYRVRPYAGLVRTSSTGYPVVFTEGGVYVTQGSDRRATGTHYTPRSLTEEIVQHTLDPLVYEGMADGVDPTPETLRPPEDILALRVCDMAMGSGAFLVQACRYLSEKLVEAWAKREGESSARNLRLPDARPANGTPAEELLPRTREERLAVARRLVVERCLYGVDKNPLAVEMAKLSLWLITLDEKKPFTFLDHALRCGDSLLGVTRREQIECFHLEPEGKTKQIFAQRIASALGEAETVRQELEGFLVRDPRDGERKVALLAKAESLTEGLRAGADLLVGVQLATRGKGTDDALALVTPMVARAFAEGWEEVRSDARRRLDAGKPASEPPRRPFHWVLEFPEVFSDENFGFDAFVGNPPFKRGKDITGLFGTDFRELLVEHVAQGQRGGNADLCAFFLLRAHSLLRRPGSAGMLATNTIAEGETRVVGLDQLDAHQVRIVRAVPSFKWPGKASLEVAQVWFWEGKWQGRCCLNGVSVPRITSMLTKPGRVVGKPNRLAANADRSFVGCVVLGMGFVMPPEAAQALIRKDPRNREVLFPYLIGKDLNGRADQTPSRWIINFRDWPRERAMSYGDCWSIIERDVKPERQRRKPDGSFKQRKPLPQRYWQYADKRPGLYRTIETLPQVIVFAQTSKTKYPAMIPTGLVFDQKTVVIASSRYEDFALLCSHLHYFWAIQEGSTLRTDAVYTPSTCFETFPFPSSMSHLEDIGKTYIERRRRIMLDRREGLTKTYNRFHDPDETAPDIVRLREHHQRMDEEVNAAYGWTDLELHHGFHGTKQGVRFTLAGSARKEVLQRLLALNHQRYAEEVAQGLHDKESKKKAAKKRKKPAAGKAEKQSNESSQGLLF